MVTLLMLKALVAAHCDSKQSFEGRYEQLWVLNKFNKAISCVASTNLVPQLFGCYVTKPGKLFCTHLMVRALRPANTPLD